MTPTAAATESTVTVVYAESPDDLYHRHPGQYSAQPSYVYLDCAGGVLRVGYSPLIGGGTPVDVYHGRTIRWRIPALTVRAANRLLDRLSTLAERVVAGYSTRWDGSNRVGVYDEDARDAADAIAELCERHWGEDEIQQRWEASDYYAGISRRELLSDTGLAAETSDEELAAIVAAEESRVESWMIVDGIGRYFDWLRDELRAEAA